MPGSIRYPEQLVFGLDIGTRSIVGTVGYKDGQKFKVVAQVSRFHETRAMLDGQIHDIGQVSDTISVVKRELERIVKHPLKDVCIAAAGRVLKTITVRTDYDFGSETVITEEHVHSLDMLAVEKAYGILREDMNEQDLKFYCVGYTVIHYYLNDYAIMNLLGHKVIKAGTELIATFLPEEVIDGLYTAVQKAGLFVANLTLEPIAAINVAIPENYRLLNIALVDVGAGTSDISITKDGSIIAYGMIPYAGDEITEMIAKHYLTDFKTAEKIKIACLSKKTVTYKDIMSISHKMNTKDVLDVTRDTVQMITQSISDRIVELNGDKPVSAVFIVGGGGKLPGFAESVAQYLGIAKERVALRGREVLANVEFANESIKKDSLLVTPVGICLNFYEQKNNFIFIQLNGQRVKLYDNSKMTIADVAVQVGFPNEKLFAQRGKALTYFVDGEKRMVRGQSGESAIVKLNGKITGISSRVEQNDIIDIKPSTAGEDAKIQLLSIPECKGSVSFNFNGKRIKCPKFAEVNNELVSEFYEVQEGDQIHVLNYYTLKQILSFMDISMEDTYYVNNLPAILTDKIYENFTISCEEKSGQNKNIMDKGMDGQNNPKEKNTNEEEKEITVTINDEIVVLSGKAFYIFVDILDVYSFDLSAAHGTKLVTRVNKKVADFTTVLNNNDFVELYWEE